MCRISKGVMVSSSGCLNAKAAAPLVGGGRCCRQSATVLLCQRRMGPCYGWGSSLWVGTLLLIGAGFVQPCFSANFHV